MDKEQPLPSSLDKLLLSSVVVLERINVSRCESCYNIYCNEESLKEHLYTHIKCEDTGTDIKNTNNTVNRKSCTPLNKLTSNIVATLKTQPYLSSRERIMFESDTDDDDTLSAEEVKGEIIEDNFRGYGNQNDRDHTVVSEFETNNIVLDPIVNSDLSIIPAEEIKREIIEDHSMVYRHKIKYDSVNMAASKFKTVDIPNTIVNSDLSNNDFQHTISNRCKEKTRSPKQVVIKDQESNGKFACNICYKYFTDEPSWTIHEIVYHSKIVVKKDAYGCEVLEYPCKICGRPFLKKCLLKHHVERHILEKSFECEVCQNKFRYKHQLQIHQRIHTGEKPLSCNYCNKSFRHYSSLHVHRHLCTKDPNSQALKPTCAICNKQFSQKQSILKHIYAIHITSGYTCLICKQEFGHPVARESHMALHNTEDNTTPFKCSVCAKCYDRKDLLNRHKLSHDKPFKCQHCNKKFGRKERLADHIRRHHQKEFPFTCDICKKKFARKDHLTRHNRDVKCKLKPHKCDTCTMSFANSKKLKQHWKNCLWKIKHMQAKQGKRKHFKCDNCKKIFITKRWIIRHMRNHEAAKQ